MIMRIIGIDLDNTIIQYDEVIYQEAVRQGLISEDTPHNKMIIRDILRSQNHETEWTEIQGYVYGLGMHRAHLFHGVLKFLEELPSFGLKPTIISHRSKKPFRGGDIDLHQTASDWLMKQGITGDQGPVRREDIFFEVTREEKYQRIREMNCCMFIDDLIEFLSSELFPAEVRPILFDPWSNIPDGAHSLIVRSWDDASSLVQNI